MTAQFARAPHVSGRPTAPVYNAPHAALLIDFDNVTMGIRSDLTKELKNLLNSDIIKGKVAVQRAYADWRRYPQYIVPLAENSVDLIFAPAYGSSKKNATDIRLSIDALELVFTRPEIGTFILLSGDSDFSSLVLKLKEYGKYVIGVGIRESASDLLVQNCDEYYSYSALTGLTRTGDEELRQWDPWECVEIAVQRMADNNDVMRSDRLKQVILELDPTFDEKALGFTKFNRFLQEAGSRGLLQLHKLENGQYEVAPIDPNAPPLIEVEQPEVRPRRRRRAQPEADSTGIGEPAETPAPTESAAPAAASAPPPAFTMDQAFALLRDATRDVTRGGRAARDSDVKRRILELHPTWNEPALGFSKFSRFLRQAHDAEVINLHKLDNGNYEVALPESLTTSSVDATETQLSEMPRRGRGRERKPGRAGERERGRERERATESAQPTREEILPPAAAAAGPALSHSPLRPRSSRGRPRSDAPPPLLPGQTIAPAAEVKAAKPVDAEDIIARLTAYKGVGRKTAEAAIEAFGAGNVFDVLRHEPDRVRDTLGARRAEPLITGLNADTSSLSENGASDGKARTRTGRKSPRGKRGGRGRRRSSTSSS